MESAENLEREVLLKQYSQTRSEIERGVFVQYEVIKIGGLALGTLLAGVPTGYSVLGINDPRVLATTLVCISFISLSFVFIMGAGEIRIMRAAAFSNRLLTHLLCPACDAERELLWDHFVARWNSELNGAGGRWRYQERTFLAMPFLVIAGLGNVGAAVALACWAQTAEPRDVILAMLALMAAVVAQGALYWLPVRLSGALASVAVAFDLGAEPAVAEQSTAGGLMGAQLVQTAD